MDESYMGCHDSLYWILVHTKVKNLPRIVGTNVESRQIITEQRFWYDVYQTHKLPPPIIPSNCYKRNYIYYRTGDYISQLMGGEPLLFYLTIDVLHIFSDIQESLNWETLTGGGIRERDGLYILKFDKDYRVYILSDNSIYTKNYFKYLDVFGLISLLLMAKIRIYTMSDATVLNEYLNRDYIYVALLTPNKNKFFLEYSDRDRYRNVLTDSINLMIINETPSRYNIYALDMLSNILKLHSTFEFNTYTFIDISYQRNIKLIKIPKYYQQPPHLEDVDALHLLPSTI